MLLAAGFNHIVATKLVYLGGHYVNPVLAAKNLFAGRVVALLSDEERYVIRTASPDGTSRFVGHGIFLISR